MLSSRCVMKPSLQRSGSNSRLARRSTRAEGSSASSCSSEASSAGETCVRREEWLKACASRSTRARSRPSAVRRCSARVRESVSAPTPGCPSMSEPAHEPKPTSRPSARTSKVRSSSSSTSGTASNSVASKKNRLRRTSSSTIGRTRRTSSVCHSSVTVSRSSPSRTRRRERPMRGSSRASSRRAMRSWWSSTERRVASVGCAVSTSSRCRERTAAARSAPDSRSRSAASMSDSRWRVPVAS